MRPLATLMGKKFPVSCALVALGWIGSAVPISAQGLFDGDGPLPISNSLSIEFDVSAAFPFIQQQLERNLPNTFDRVQVAADVVSFLGGQLEALNTQAFSAPESLGQALGTALGQANRPSVLTPYAGQLPVESDVPVFDSYGSLATNKAATIGRGNFAVGLSYQHSRFRDFDGEPIGRLISSEAIGDPVIGEEIEVFILPDGSLLGIGNDIEVTNSSLQVTGVKFTADVITLSMTYGLLDRLDIGALIPYVFLRTEGKAVLTFDATSTIVGIRDDGINPPQIVVGGPGEELSGSITGATISDDFEEDFEGLGDTVLFAKFQVLSQPGLIGETHTPAPLDLAIQTELQIPTGNENNFLGTGNIDVAFRLIAQREIVAQRLRVRGEIGYNFSGTDSDFSAVEFKGGLEWLPLPSSTLPLALSVELIGSESDEFDSIVDAAVGAKYILPGDVGFFGGIRFPLNENGLRPGVTPIIGIEKTFYRPLDSGDLAHLPAAELPEFKPRMTASLATPAGIDGKLFLQAVSDSEAPANLPPRALAELSAY